jgi:hypothetical protein
VDIASLGIKVTTSGTKEASADLDKLAASGARAEQSVKRIAPVSKTSSEALALFAKIDPLAGKLQKFDDLEVALGKLSKAGKIGATDFAVMSEKLAANRAALFGAEAATVGASSAIAKFTSNTRLMSEASTIASDVVSGQFGRIRRSAAAMANASGVLRLAFTGVGAVVLGLTAVLGGLAYAWNEASERESAFDKGLILTGNYARTTSKALQGMASDLSAATDATKGKATDVLAQVVASGQFTAQQFGLVSKAAILMEEATGQSIDNTVKQFESLKEAPTEYILKLNEAGQVTHFLTQETLRTIESLEDQGRTTDAAAVAMKAYADAINNRAPKVLDNLGAFASGWRLVKIAAGDAADSIVGAMGRADSAIKQALTSIATASARSKTLLEALPGGTALVVGASALTAASHPFDATKPATASASPVVDSAQARATRKAQEDFDRLHDRYLTRAQQLEVALAEAQKVGVAAGKSQLEIDKQKAAIRASFAQKERKPRKESENAIQEGKDRFDDMTARFQSELDGPLRKAEEEHLRRMRELEEAAKKGKVGHDELAASLALESKAYAKTTDDIKLQIDAQVAGFLGPVAQAQQAHANALHEIDELTKQGSMSAAQHAQALDEEARAYRADMESAKRAADPMKAMLDDMQFELKLLGLTNAERQTAIQQRELERQGIKANTAELLAQNQAYENQQKAIALMDQFRQGAVNALTEFVTGAKSAKDALKDFFNELAQEITQAIAKKWMEQLFGQQGTSQGGSAGGGWFSAIAAMFGGGSANGNAFAGGNAMAFASGGIVNRTTAFGMSGGRFGIMGEAGPEAILPLHRGPDGKLGVRMEAANDDRLRPVVNNNTTFVMPERYSQQNQAQIAQNQQRAATRATSRNR